MKKLKVKHLVQDLLDLAAICDRNKGSGLGNNKYWGGMAAGYRSAAAWIEEHYEDDEEEE